MSTDRNYGQAAEELNIPVSWLQAKAAARQIPHHRYGRHVRFTDDDIAAIRAMSATEPLRQTPALTLAFGGRRTATTSASRRAA